MKTVVFACVILLAAQTVGCAPAPRSAKLTGMIVRPEAEITTRHLLTFRVEYPARGVSKHYDILFGPNPPQTTEARGWFIDTSPAWTFHVAHSFTLFKGYWPVGQTERVRAGGIGTTMLLQIEDPAVSDVHRVFLLENHGSRVWAQSRLVPMGENPDVWPWRGELSELSTYFEIGADGKLAGPKRVNDDPDIRAFVDYVLRSAQAAGM
jgi:hypothetical protein